MDFDSIYYYEDTPEERRRKVRAEETSSELFQSIIKLIGIILFVSFLYSSSIFASYFLLKGTNLYAGLQGWEKFIAVVFLAYLISSVVFYFKGIMIVLRAARNGWWLLIWFVCFLFVCLLPAVAVYFILESMLGPSIPAKSDGIHNYQVWSAAGAVIAGLIIYAKYGLSKDSVLKISFWAYALGKRTCRYLLGGDLH